MMVKPSMTEEQRMSVGSLARSPADKRAKRCRSAQSAKHQSEKESVSSCWLCCQVELNMEILKKERLANGTKSCLHMFIHSGNVCMMHMSSLVHFHPAPNTQTLEILFAANVVRMGNFTSIISQFIQQFSE